jgi:hypothetical protein
MTEGLGKRKQRKGKGRKPHTHKEKIKFHPAVG